MKTIKSKKQICLFLFVIRSNCSANVVLRRSLVENPEGRAWEVFNKKTLCRGSMMLLKMSRTYFRFFCIFHYQVLRKFSRGVLLPSWVSLWCTQAFTQITKTIFSFKSQTKCSIIKWAEFLSIFLDVCILLIEKKNAPDFFIFFIFFGANFLKCFPGLRDNYDVYLCCHCQWLKIEDTSG